MYRKRINIDEDVAQFEVEGRYLEAIRLIIEEVKVNYDKLSATDELRNIYIQLSFLGNDNGLPQETERRVLELVKMQRQVFIEKFNQNARNMNVDR